MFTRTNLLLTLALLCFLGQATLSLADEPKTGEKRDTLLYVRTVPPGAKVLLGDTELGKSDDIFAVPPGVSKIVVELPGYKPDSKPVTIKANEVTRVELVLKPQTEATPAAAADGDTTQLRQEGWQLLQSGRYVEAVAMFQQAVKVAPKNDNAWDGLGFALSLSGKRPEAIEAYEKALEINPDHSEALKGLGQLCFGMRQFDLAERYLLKAAPHTSDAWDALVKLYLLEGKYEEAEKFAQRIEDSGQTSELVKKMLQAAKEKKLSNDLRAAIEPPQHKAQPTSQPLPEPADFVARLPQGTVELVGINAYPVSENSPWWRPDGSRVRVGNFRPRNDLIPSMLASSSQQARVFLFRCDDLPADASWPTMRLKPSDRMLGIEVVDERGQIVPNCKMCIALLPASAQTADFRVGIAMGEWETVATAEAGAESTSSFVRDDKSWTVTFEKPIADSAAGGTQVRLKTNVQNTYRTRLVAIGADGGEHLPSSGFPNNTDTATFSGLALSSVKEFRLQIDPFAWVEFKDIALLLGQTTDAKIVAQAPPAAEKAAANDLARLQGTWLTLYNYNYWDGLKKDFRSMGQHGVIKDNTLVWTSKGQWPHESTFTLDETTNPKRIDMTPNGENHILLGIYKLDGDELTICSGSSGDRRPDAFEAAKGSGRVMSILRRVKDEPPPVKSTPTTSSDETKPVTARAEPAPTVAPAADGGPFIARLPQGTVELVGVTNYPPTNQSQWWRPDGSPAQVGPFQGRFNALAPSADQQARTFLLRFADVPADASWPVWKFEPNANVEGTAVTDNHGDSLRNYKMVAASLPTSAQTSNLRMGLGMDAWETVVAQKPDGLGTSTFSRDGKEFTVTFQTATETSPGTTRVAFTSTLPYGKYLTQMMAIANDGREHPFYEMQSRNGKGTATVHDLPLSSIKEFCYQVRPYFWVEFKNIALAAGQATDVQVVSAEAPASSGGQQAKAPEAAPVDPRFSANFPQGVIELVGITNYPLTKESSWWRPDGTAAQLGPYQPVEPKEPWKMPADQKPRTFLLRLKNLPANASHPGWAPDGMDTWGSTSISNIHGVVPNYTIFCGALGASAETAYFRVCIGMGEWETVATQPSDNIGASNFTRDGQQCKVTLRDVTATSDNGTQVGVMADMPFGKWNARLVAVARDGSEHVHNIGYYSLSDTALFRNVPVSTIKEYRYQLRPCYWVGFKNIPIEPGQKAETKILMPDPPTWGDPPKADESKAVPERVGSENPFDR